MKNRIVKVFIMALFACILFTGCMLMREVPIGYALPPCGSLQITGGFSESPSNIVSFTNLATRQDNFGQDYFYYNDQLYKVTSRPISGISRVNEKEYTHFGNLKNNIDNEANSHSIDILFLNNSYIYYQLRATRRFNQGLHMQDVIFYKFAFFRFNLDTAENEEVSLEYFFDKLIPVRDNHLPNNSPITLNPSFRVREK